MAAEAAGNGPQSNGESTRRSIMVVMLTIRKITYIKELLSICMLLPLGTLLCQDADH